MKNNEKYKDDRKMALKILIIGILIVSIGFCGCIEDNDFPPKGYSYSSELSQQYFKSCIVFNSVDGSNNPIENLVGIDFKVYVKEDLIKIYSAPVIPNPEYKFKRNGSIDDNGIINFTGWQYDNNLSSTIQKNSTETYYVYLNGFNEFLNSTNCRLYIKESNDSYPRLISIGLMKEDRTIEWWEI